MEEFKIFGTCEKGLEYPERPGAYGVAIRGDEILIEKARLGYFLPGGGIEEGESIEEALLREVLEEAGCECKIIKFLGSCAEYRNGPDKNFRQKKIGHFFTIKLCDNKADGTNNSASLVEWVKIAEAMEHLLLDSQKWAVEKAFRGKFD